MTKLEKPKDYRGVSLYYLPEYDKEYPFTGKGIVHLFKTLDALTAYIDKSIEKGMWAVINGALQINPDYIKF